MDYCGGRLVRLSIRRPSRSSRRSSTVESGATDRSPICPVDRDVCRLGPSTRSARFIPGRHRPARRVRRHEKLTPLSPHGRKLPRFTMLADSRSSAGTAESSNIGANLKVLRDARGAGAANASGVAVITWPEAGHLLPTVLAVGPPLRSRSLRGRSARSTQRN